MNDLSIPELVESGASINISFYNATNLQDAFKKIKPFKHLGSIKMWNHRFRTFWLKIENENIEVTVFYEGGK